MSRIRRVDRRCGRSGIGSWSGPMPAAGAGRVRRGRGLKPDLLVLEDRRLMATFTVTNPGDTTDGSGNPTSGTLRWAVDQADVASTPSTITFSLGGSPATVTLAQLLKPVELSNTAEAITIQGPGAGTLTIDGHREGAVFQIDQGVTATITGVTITNGSLDVGSDNGAISNLGTLTISNCTLTGNTISGIYDKGTATITDVTVTGGNSFFGAGIFVTGNATITGSALENNVGTQGAGICNQGTTTVTDCTISGDSALGGGGGLYNSGQLSVYNSTISGVTGGGGGGLYNKAGTAYLSGCTISDGSGFINGGGLDNNYGATLDLVGCTIESNSAITGGGLYNAGKAKLTDCTISANTSTGSGGGVASGPLQNKAVLTITGSTLVGNTAKQGGGGVFNNGAATITDSTMAGNFADQAGSLLSSNGGGLDNSGTTTLVACTITGNTTTALGGGVYNGGIGSDSVTLNDTIVAGNTSTASGGRASDIELSTGFPSDVTGSYDLVGTGGSGGLSSGGGNELGVADPGLAPLGDYGGPTETVALLATSPAIQAGSKTLEIGPGGQHLTTDQRGLPLDAPNPDIGAFQGQPGLVVNTTVDGVGSPLGDLSLRQAVNLASELGGINTILFNSTAFGTAQTIVLTGGPLAISGTAGTTTINGPAAGLTLSGGGASRVLQVEKGATATITGLTITQGSASSGGGLYNAGTTDLSDCTITGNSATAGGGLTDFGHITVTNCTIAGNAAGAGGGLYEAGSGILDACTITGNSSPVGGGIDGALAGTATLEDTIVAANTATGGAASDIGGSHAADVTGTYNLIGTGGAGGVAGGTGDIVLTSLSGLGLGAAGNYGGPTQTIPLLPGSPAIGAGKAINGLTKDQRGKPVGASVDIGAFQSQGFTLTPAAGSTPQGAAAGTAFADPLGVTVTARNPVEPVAGGVVTYTVNPNSDGASATLSAATAVINQGGVAAVTATANASIGAYSVTASASGAASPASFALSNLVQVTFSDLSSPSLTYGTSSTTLGGTLSSGTQVPQGQSVTIKVDNVPEMATVAADGTFSAAFDTAAFGVAGSPYTVSYAYTSDGVYASTSATSTLTVTPAPLTVTADAESMIYAGAVPALTYTYTGLVNGDSSASFSGGLTTTAKSSSSVGSYAIGEGTLAATGNYTIGTFNGAALTVAPAPLTVTARGQSMTYGGTVPALTYTYTGLVNGDSSAAFTGSLSTTATSSSPVNNYPISEGSLAATGNYTIGAFNAGTLAVAPAPLTVTADAQAMTYGGTVPALTYTYTGLVNGDSSAGFAGGLATTATSSSSVGSYAIGEGTLAATGNYTIGKFNGAALTVAPAPLTVTAGGRSMAYGGTVPALTYTYTGLVNGDATATFTGSLVTAATSSSSVGDYPITEGSLAASGNYTIGTFNGAALTVNPASLTVTARNLSITYGGTVPTLTYAYTGLVNGDSSATFTGGLATTATSLSGVGGYAITGGTLAATGNYTIGTVSAGTLTVNPAPLTVTASNKGMTYGGTMPALTYTYTGLVNGDSSATFTGSVATAATSSSAAGDYPITQGSLAATGNYTIGPFDAGTLSVGRAPLTVTATDRTMTYGGTVPAFTYTYTGLVNGDSSATFTGGAGHQRHLVQHRGQLPDQQRHAGGDGELRDRHIQRRHAHDRPGHAGTLAVGARRRLRRQPVRSLGHGRRHGRREHVRREPGGRLPGRDLLRRHGHLGVRPGLGAAGAARDVHGRGRLPRQYRLHRDSREVGDIHHRPVQSNDRPDEQPHAGRIGRLRPGPHVRRRDFLRRGHAGRLGHVL